MGGGLCAPVLKLFGGRLFGSHCQRFHGNSVWQSPVGGTLVARGITFTMTTIRTISLLETQQTPLAGL